MADSPAIRVRNLRKLYGNKAAVDGLDLDVPRGSFFGFLGPNGAGKTTTIRMLMGEYEKGMRKRGAMAAAMIHRPLLFLMDEPFEGVDAVGARLMKDLLQDQVRQGGTIFLTSHVREVVERLCDRVAIIHEGKLGP